MALFSKTNVTICSFGQFSFGFSVSFVWFWQQWCRVLFPTAIMKRFAFATALIRTSDWLFLHSNGCRGLWVVWYLEPSTIPNWWQNMISKQSWNNWNRLVHYPGDSHDSGLKNIEDITHWNWNATLINLTKSIFFSVQFRIISENFLKLSNNHVQFSSCKSL